VSSILDSRALIAVMSPIRVGPYYGLDLGKTTQFVRRQKPMKLEKTDWN